MRTLVLFILVGFFALVQLQAQVKIGDNPQTIDPAAVLELESTTMALIITRVNTEQMDAIVPGQGALIYNTDTSCVHYYNGTEWVNLCTGANVNVTADPIVNQLENSSDLSTIVLTQTDEGTNIEVATESLTGNQILDGSIFGEDFNDNSITGNKLANNAVTKRKMSENAIGPFAIDRDSLPLSFFINDVPFLTAGDISTVSDDAGNSLSTGGDGGAFFNATPLLDAIANDQDGDPANELQALSRTGTDLILTQPDGNNNTVSLADLVGSVSGIVSQFQVVGQNLILTEDGNDFTVPLADLGSGGNPADELQDLAFDATTNILTITTPATVGNEVDLSSLAGGGPGGTGVVDGTTLTGLGTAVDPFKIEPSETFGQFLRTDATGAVIWDDLPGGTGGAVTSDGLTITGDGITTDLAVLDAGITPIKLEPSANFGQYLRTDTNGDVIWDDLPGGTGGAVNSDGVTITGDGVASDLSVLDGGITPIKIEPSPTINQVLTTDGTGAVVWAAGGGAGSIELADQVTITGDGQVGTEFQVADDAITADKIGADVAGTGLVQNAATGALELDPTALVGNGDIIGTGITVGGDPNALLGNVTLEIEDDAVTADKIGGDVAGTGLVQNAATGALELDPTALVGDGNIVGTGITVGGDPNALLGDVTLVIEDDAVTADKIGADVAGTGLIQNAATGALELNPTALIGDGNITGTGITVGGDTNALLGDVTLAIEDDAVTAVKIGADVAGTGLVQNAATGALEVDPTVLAGNTDNQTAAEVTVAATATNYTAATADVEAHLVGINTALAGGSGDNLATADLTQTVPLRTYDLNGNSTPAGGDLAFIGTGSIGVGTSTPEAKFHVSGGQVRAATFSAGDGANAYRFSSDADTGMYRIAADEIGFNVGNTLALTIDEPTLGNTNVIVHQSLELDGQLLDQNQSSGGNGQVLTSNGGGGVFWGTSSGSTSPVKGFGKVGVSGNAIKITSGFNVTGSGGQYTVTIPGGLVTDDFIIQLSVQGDRRIFVSGQVPGTNSFDVGIRNSTSGAPEAAPWHFTVLDQ